MYGNKLLYYYDFLESRILILKYIKTKQNQIPHGLRIDAKFDIRIIKSSSNIYINKLTNQIKSTERERKLSRMDCREEIITPLIY